MISRLRLLVMGCWLLAAAQIVLTSAAAAAAGQSVIAATAGAMLDAGNAGAVPTATQDAATAAGADPQVIMLAENLVEYRPGNTPVVLVSGHDGRQRPKHIATRTTGIRGNDWETLPLTLELNDAFIQSTAARPHLVLCHLARAKVDVNRDLGTAHDGDAGAQAVWLAYHDSIDKAVRQAIKTHGFAFLIDIHRHPHKEVRLEIGQAITRNELNLSDAELDQPQYVRRSSLELAASRYEGKFSQLLRGQDSIGHFYYQQGLRAIPSPEEPQPGDEPFYSGGYTTRHHTAKPLVDGLQIEVSRESLKEEGYNQRFTAATIDMLRTFLKKHYDYTLPEASVE